MKLYRVTTTFIGADSPSVLYFNTEEKAQTFLSTCQNGGADLVDVLTADGEYNYSDGCTLNDLTFGAFNAKIIPLREPGWVDVRGLGDVYLNENGKVVRSVRDGVAVYPYRWNARTKVWDNRSGEYTPAYLKKLLGADKALWA